MTTFIPDRNFSASDMKLFVGQRNSENHSLFKVSDKNISKTETIYHLEWFY